MAGSSSRRSKRLSRRSSGGVPGIFFICVGLGFGLFFVFGHGCAAVIGVLCTAGEWWWVLWVWRRCDGLGRSLFFFGFYDFGGFGEGNFFLLFSPSVHPL